MKARPTYTNTAHLIIVYLVIVLSLILTKHIFYQDSTNYSRRAVLGSTYPPSIPDFSANAGGVKTINNVTVLLTENTFPYDTYFWVNPRTKTTPVFVSGYFQVSDMNDVWFRKQSDNSKIVYPPKKYIVSILYNETWLYTDQSILFPENSIKIAYSASYDGPWTLLSTALNSDQNTAGTVTDKGGFYMLVAGFGTLLPTATPTMTPTSTPSPTPTPTPTLQPSPTLAPTITPTNTPIVPTDSITKVITTPQKITIGRAVPQRRDFLDRIIDALLLLITGK